MGLLQIIIALLMGLLGYGIAYLVGKFVTAHSLRHKIVICVFVPLMVCATWFTAMYGICHDLLYALAYSILVIIVTIAYIIFSLFTVKQKH